MGLMSLINNQNLGKKIKAKSVDLSSYDAIYFVKTEFRRKFHGKAMTCLPMTL